MNNRILLGIAVVVFGFHVLLGMVVLLSKKFYKHVDSGPDRESREEGE